MTLGRYDGALLTNSRNFSVPPGILTGKLTGPPLVSSHLLR
jgi:hypothetical protein